MYHTGKVKAQDLYNAIVSKVTAVQPGESTAWWTNQSSLAADGVFASTGSTGNERIIAIIRPGTVGHFLVIGYARDYTPGSINTTGAFDLAEVQNMEYFTTAQAATAEVTYHLNITKDRIILHIQGDKLITGWANGVAYIGMPIRYDVNDKRCIVKCFSEDAPIKERIRLIQDSINQTLQDYTWHWTASPGNPSWGGNYFIEPLCFGKTGEGLRGELDGLFGMHPDGVVDGNVVNSNGNDYLIIKRTVNGNNGFPRDCLALKMS